MFIAQNSLQIFLREQVGFAAVLWRLRQCVSCLILISMNSFGDEQKIPNKTWKVHLEEKGFWLGICGIFYKYLCSVDPGNCNSKLKIGTQSWTGLFVCQTHPSFKVIYARQF